MNLQVTHGCTEKIVTVVQGDYFVTSNPNVVIATVLGSCVSVCLFDAQIGVGGMNHFLLANQGDIKSNDLKYGVNAMELLINKLLVAGGSRQEMQAKLFGGARMTEHAQDIGGANARFALEFLKRESIPCVSQSLGGNKARRVRFYPTTGAAKQLQISGISPMVEPANPVGSVTADITLF
jgi:chemotaxis protein CheD